MAGWVPRRLRGDRIARRERRVPQLKAAAANGSRSDLQARLSVLEAEMGRLEAILEKVDAELASRIEESVYDRAALAAAVKRLEREADAVQTEWKAHDKPERTFPELPDRPVVPVESSITADAIICLIDGVPRKMLHRHLRTRYGISPEEYRSHFGLPDDYPMTAPGYSKSQSKAVTAAIEDGRYTPHLAKLKEGGRKKSRKGMAMESSNGRK